MSVNEALVVYTDGACVKNPGPGGWAWVVPGPPPREGSGSSISTTTNNRMELIAVLEAIKALGDVGDLVIRSDSRYVVDGFTKWLAGWKHRGWVTGSKKPVKNRDLWEALDEVAARRGRSALTLEWVRGHHGDRWNERADGLAEAAARRRPADTDQEALDAAFDDALARDDALDERLGLDLSRPATTLPT